MSHGEEPWLIGLNAVSSALENDPGNLVEIWLDAERHDRRARELSEAATRSGIPLTRVARAELKRRFGRQRHQGVAARYRAPRPLELDALRERLEGDPQALLLALDHIEDPGNFGACLRTAEAAGARAVIFPKDRAVGLTPSARKAASGAAERLPLVQVTNLVRALKTLKEDGFWIAGAAGDADTPLYRADFGGRLVLVLGSEAKGLHRLVRETCDFLVRIPMAEPVESLNVSAAAAVMLYEAVRQRREKS